MRQLTATAGALVMAFTMVACGPSPESEPADESVLPDVGTSTEGTAGAAPEREMPDVADLVSEPDRFAGQTVTVEADVEEVYGPMAFALDEDSPLEGGIDNDLLVLSRKAGSLEEIDDQWLDNRVRVTGRVGKMTLVEIEKELGWDLNTELEAELEEAEAVLIADSVTRIEN